MIVIGSQHKRRSAISLCIVVFGWLGVLGMPCAMSAVPDTLGGDLVTVIGVHADCPNAEQSKPMFDVDCCCDPVAAIGAGAPELPKPVPLIARSIDIGLFNPTPANEVMLHLQEPPLNETSPPIYLATQRIRI